MAERKRGLNEISYTNPVKEKAANQWKHYEKLMTVESWKPAS
jgi:hypothetical protein